MSDSVWPHRRQPTRLPCPWDSPGKNTGVGCHFLLQRIKVKSERLVAQSCPTLSDPMDCSLPGSFVPGIFQARALEWGAIAFSVYVWIDWQKCNQSLQEPTLAFFWGSMVQYLLIQWLENKSKEALFPVIVGTLKLFFVLFLWRMKEQCLHFNRSL